MIQTQTERQDYETPPDFVRELEKEFGPFQVDVAAREDNKKAPRCFTPEMDGLAQDWTGLRCWMNPPYGRGIGAWVEKAATGGAALVVALLPARTDTRWFHDHIYGKAEIRFLKGRVKFWLDGEPTNAPGKFPSMIVIWKAKPQRSSDPVNQNHNKPGDPCDSCKRPLTGGGGIGPTSCRHEDCDLYDDCEGW